MDERQKDAEQFIFSSDVTRENRVTDRSLRKWIAAGRFPPPDGNLNGRNFWFEKTYRVWRDDVVAGKYARQRFSRNLRSSAKPTRDRDPSLNDVQSAGR